MFLVFYSRSHCYYSTTAAKSPRLSALSLGITASCLNTLYSAYNKSKTNHWFSAAYLPLSHHSTGNSHPVPSSFWVVNSNNVTQISANTNSWKGPDADLVLIDPFLEEKVSDTKYK